MVLQKVFFGLLFIYLQAHSLVSAQNYLAIDNFQKAEIEVHAEHYKEAITYLTHALSHSREYLAAYFLRGKTYWLQGKKDLAQEDFLNTLKLDSTYASALFYLGILQYDENHYEEAIQYFNQAIHYNPDDALAYNYRAECYKELGLFTPANQDYTEAIRVVPNEPTLYEGRGKCHLRHEKYDLAAQDFSQAIMLRPRKLLYYQYRAEAYFLNGDYQKAAQDLDRMIRAKDGKIALHYYDINAFCKAQSQDYVGAIQALDEVIVQEPSAERYAQRSQYNLSLGIVVSAIYDLTQAIELDPKNLSYYRTCGELYFDRNDYENAALYLDYFIQKEEAPAEIWYKRGISYLKLEKRNLARADFIQAAQRGFPEEQMEEDAYKYAKKVYKRLHKKRKKQEKASAEEVKA